MLLLLWFPPLFLCFARSWRACTPHHWSCWKCGTQRCDSLLLLHTERRHVSAVLTHCMVSCVFMFSHQIVPKLSDNKKKTSMQRHTPWIMSPACNSVHQCLLLCSHNQQRSHS